ncbi:hypothetical protein [Mesorhizobium tamadayense]|uniref:hypothetical protein n=1 Tax=Mesorhizobium tamadayense TaxID=425306 RepID=UPI00142E65E1|nr:hypothetical protein [Mesorhizobium tamadayense]
MDTSSTHRVILVITGQLAIAIERKVRPVLGMIRKLQLNAKPSTRLSVPLR